MKKINLNEEFSMEGNVYIFTQKDDYISLKRVRESKSKPSFIPPTEQQVKDYFQEKGYTEQSAIKAFEYYSVADWKDSRGQQVLNWKSKMIANWMRDENKIVEQNSRMVR